MFLGFGSSLGIDGVSSWEVVVTRNATADGSTRRGNLAVRVLAARGRGAGRLQGAARYDQVYICRGLRTSGKMVFFMTFPHACIATDVFA